MANKKLGTITHYYDKLGVAVVKLSSSLSAGDEIKIETKDEEFTQTVKSMEIDHKKLDKAKKGQEVGLEVDKKVKKGDLVYKV